jgi:heat shock protein HspQ
MISIAGNGQPGHGDGSAPRFAPGDVVRHVRYGYRGVVVAVDAHCKAPDAWYQNNQTQPARGQPWYHVLVDGASHTTYPAEENLMPDASGEPVAHPLLKHFFSALAGGRYIRNARPWPA